ncbi:MAG: hypothetical protein CL850_05290 [Crocinitomicaceae bacterium]|nr:hypothetical protein [Crocinitomicaceae bacterium]
MLKFIKILALISFSLVIPKSLNANEMINDITDELGATIKLLEEFTDALTKDGVCTGQDSSVDIQELQRLVEKMPRNSLNIPMQWFEMDCTYGWGKMMLIMGYEDNRKACLSILEATVA